MKVIRLPVPLSSGETLKICAFDETVLVEGCDAPLELRRGETAAFVTVALDEDRPAVVRRWERVQALPGDNR